MEKIVYDGFIKVKEVEVSIKGDKRIYNEICSDNVVAAILVDEEGKIGIVNQLRPFVNQVTKEIVAETMDKGLDKLETIIEGLKEEADIDREQIISVKEITQLEYFMMVNCSKSELYMYEIHVSKQENKLIDDVDVESVEWLTLDEMKQYVEEEKVKDAKTLLAYYYLLSKKDILD